MRRTVLATPTWSTSDGYHGAARKSDHLRQAGSLSPATILDTGNSSRAYQKALPLDGEIPVGSMSGWAVIPG